MRRELLRPDNEKFADLEYKNPRAWERVLATLGDRAFPAVSIVATVAVLIWADHWVTEVWGLGLLTVLILWGWFRSGKKDDGPPTNQAST